MPGIRLYANRRLLLMTRGGDADEGHGRPQILRHDAESRDREPAAKSAMVARRARVPDQPRRMKNPGSQPPKTLPRSAAR
jgi:hypothetical protein